MNFSLKRLNPNPLEQLMVNNSSHLNKNQGIMTNISNLGSEISEIITG